MVRPHRIYVILVLIGQKRGRTPLNWPITVAYSRSRETRLFSVGSLVHFHFELRQRTQSTLLSDIRGTQRACYWKQYNLVKIVWLSFMRYCGLCQCPVIIYFTIDNYEFRYLCLFLSLHFSTRKTTCFKLWSLSYLLNKFKFSFDLKKKKNFTILSSFWHFQSLQHNICLRPCMQTG